MCIRGGLCGDEAGAQVFAQLRARLGAFVAQHPRGKTPAGLTERDAILITYGDQLSEPGQPPLQTLADFEAYAAGTSVMFRDPAFSGSTSSHLDTNPGVANFTRVTNNFPAGHASARVLQASWTFKSGTANPWLRLTTSSAPNLPNPVIGFNQVLRFDLYTDRDLYVAIGLRETNTGAPIGGDGGTSGAIEWVGGTTNNSISPPRGRLVTAGQWTTLEFFIPYEPVRASTGNGLLELSLIHISEPTRLLSISSAVFCLKKKTHQENRLTSDSVL